MKSIETGEHPAITVPLIGQATRPPVYRTLQFHERGQNFFGAHDETLSVDMSVYNPDRSPPSESIADTQPQLH